MLRCQDLVLTPLSKNRKLAEKNNLQCIFSVFSLDFMLLQRNLRVRIHFSPSLCKATILPRDLPIQTDSLMLYYLFFSASQACDAHLRKLSYADSAFKRGIRTELNWITSPLPALMAAINFANSADGKPIIWWLLCNRIAGWSTS